MWHAFDTSEKYLQTLFDTISTRLQDVVDAQGHAHLAVSGGRSPIPLFDRLSQATIDWPKIHISLVDERFVAPDSQDSNEHLVRSHLLVNRAAQAQFTGLVSDPADLQRCLDRANRTAGTISLAILGMGDDGHTASLFPGAVQLPVALDPGQAQRYVHVTPPAAPHERISMTLAALLHTGQLILTIAGPHKRSVFEQAARKATPLVPISYLIAQSAVPLDVYWHG